MIEQRDEAYWQILFRDVMRCDPQVVGRLAAQLSKILQGKDKPTYAPNKDLGDVCIVVNASRIELTGKKWDQKVYRWHTGGMDIGAQA